MIFMVLGILKKKQKQTKDLNKSVSVVGTKSDFIRSMSNNREFGFGINVHMYSQN
jgi:hypothetical protein